MPEHEQDPQRFAPQELPELQGEVVDITTLVKGTASPEQIERIKQQILPEAQVAILALKLRKAPIALYRLTRN